MSALDRILRAYTRKYRLTAEQAATVREELAAFVDRFSSGNFYSAAANDSHSGVAEPKR